MQSDPLTCTVKTDVYLTAGVPHHVALRLALYISYKEVEPEITINIFLPGIIA